MFTVSFANISLRPDVDLPHEATYECPDDAISLIEEYHCGLHSIVLTKKEGRNKFTPIGKVVCQDTKDRNSRPEATPHELSEIVMQWIQYEIDETDDPGTYRMQLIGPPGKGNFRRSKHIDLSSGDGIARTKDMLSEGDMIEQQSHYIGSLHEQLTGMVDLVLGSYKIVVGENREMMKILSEATRKHGDIEAQRLAHQLEMRVHEDEIKHQDMEAERSLQKFREGLAVFKETNAAEELVRAVAKKIQGAKEGMAASNQEASTPAPTPAPIPPPTLVPVADPDEPEEKTTKAKSGKKKASKKKKAKKSTKKGRLKKVADLEEDADAPDDEAILAEGRELQEMVMERPLVMAAEALKMSIDANSQWSLIRKTLSEDQADILDEIFAASDDGEVRDLAQKLYDTKGFLKMLDLKKHLDDQQEAFIGLVMSQVKQ